MSDDPIVDWKTIYSEIEDLLIPSLTLDAWDRALYYHLLRHTRLKGKDSGIFAIGPLSKATSISDIKVREVIRALHHKGCLRIEDRSRQGHLIFVLLPSEIPGVVPPVSVSQPLDPLSIDFFSGRQYLEALLRRENWACFFCLKRLNKDSCELDHLIPQKEFVDNSYKNIVVACHTCNKAKGDQSAGDFLRTLYRTAALNESEFQQRLSSLESVQAGRSIPEVSVASAANKTPQPAPASGRG